MTVQLTRDMTSFLHGGGAHAVLCWPISSRQEYRGDNADRCCHLSGQMAPGAWEVLMPHNISLDCFSILLASRNHSTNYIRIDDVKNLLHTIRAKMNILLISRACQQQCVGQWTGWPHGGEREPSMISSGIHWSRKTVCSVICSTFRIQWTPSWLHSREEHTTTLLCNGVPLTLNITTFFRPTNSVIQRAWQISLLHLQIQPLFCFSGQICESIRYHLTECPVA